MNEMELKMGEDHRSCAAEKSRNLGVGNWPMKRSMACIEAARGDRRPGGARGGDEGACWWSSPSSYRSSSC